MKQGHRFLIGALVVVALAAALVLLAAGGQGAIAQGSIIFVDADAVGNNDGSSWDDAYTTLQPALLTADTGYEIWVAEGTYKPTNGTDRDASFQMKKGVAIYGGFAGTEIDLEDRDLVVHVTILSGDIGIVGDNSDNSYHVFYHPEGTDLDSTAILDGFTISGGNADGDYPHHDGGGMFNYASSPTLINCTFVSNWASNGGGGMYNTDSSSPSLTDCAFLDNSADWNFGGGMANISSSPTLTNCTFADNWAYGSGGGMYNNNGSSPTLTNCTFYGNSVIYYGAGMANLYSSPILTNCILWGNSPDQISNNNSSALVTYSNVQWGYAGEGNISADPLFVDAANGDFHLWPASRCIDAGSNAASHLPEYDFEGDARILDGDGDGAAIVDMGVDEVYYEPPPPPPDVIFVDSEASGANTGTSWVDAFTTLQPALSWAVDGVEIWVAEGTYKPSRESSPGYPRSASFQMKNGVAIYGGFDPSVDITEFEDRDWVTHATILSGDLNGDDEPGFVNDRENSYHVFYHPEYLDLDGSAILDGFIITGGNANDGYAPHHDGGGMFNEGSSPTLTNCIFSGNWAYDAGGMWNGGGSSPTLSHCTFSGNAAGSGTSSSTGGGMVNRDASSPTLTDCTFTDNSAGAGGAMYNRSNSAPTLIDCTFEDNWANQYGGAMYNVSSSPTLTNCTFTGNSAYYGSGGMSNRDASSPTLTNCAFTGNSAGNGAGGMGNERSSPTLTNCTFVGNSAGSEHSGGGMRNHQSSPVLTNCVFSGNSADYGGGGMANYYSSPILTNCILWDNTAGSYGGGMYSIYSSAELTNCIVWGNSPDQISNDDSAPVVTYSDVQGGYEGKGNIDLDPLLVDATIGDYHLGAGSPCIDAGSNEASYLPEYDFEGDARVQDGDGFGTATVDMGVDEVVYSGPPGVEVEIDIKPGSDQNSINLGSQGMLSVAVLTNEAFDVSTIDLGTVLFAEAVPVRSAMRDVDGDGDEDLILYFEIQALDLDAISTEATLTGETFDGMFIIRGTDTVKIVP